MSTSLPGRAVDIVHAAARRAGLTCAQIQVHLGDRAIDKVTLFARGRINESSGRAVFAALGVGDAFLGPRYGGGPQADLQGDVPAMGALLSIVITDLPAAPDVQAGDVEALVAEVDAARAAADEQAGGGEGR